MIHQVPVSLVEDIWPAIHKFVEAACEYNPYVEAEDLKLLILNSRVTLFIADQDSHIVGFGAMELVKYPRRTVANILAAGGEPNGFLRAAITELLPVLKRWGLEQGADTVSITGRPGWLKALKAEGGKTASYAMWWQRIDHV